MGCWAIHGGRIRPAVLFNDLSAGRLMHVLFLHANFPAQFGQIASYLAENDGYRCTFLNEKQSGRHAGIDCVQFTPPSGATPHNHFCSATFENQIWRSSAAHDAMRQHIELASTDWQTPDLIVAHSGFVSALFLAELFPTTPVLGYFEWFYRRRGSDFDFRSDLPAEAPMSAMRLRARNAGLLLDLNHCVAGYCPTDFQRSQFPNEYQSKLHTIFDGIDTTFWRRDESMRHDEQVRSVAGVDVPAGHKIVTFVSRGFESMRGGDLFLQVAAGICRLRDDVTFIVVGEDRVAYGGDGRFTGSRTFRQWSLDRTPIDPERVHFVGRLAASDLVQVFSASDLHLYWTVPFVLSWSVVNAMACRCAILASDTAPVRELITDGETGVLVDFFNVDAWVDAAMELLTDVETREHLGRSARSFVDPRYSLPACLGQMRELFSQVTS